MAELIGGGGYDDVQATAPSNPKIGDTWLDTSGGEATGKIYADLGNGPDWQILPVQDELQSGRTRELLLLLQDKPVPEVQDPLNIQSGFSKNYATDGNDYVLSGEDTVSDTEPSTGSDDFGTTNSGVAFTPEVPLKSVSLTTFDNFEAAPTNVEIINEDTGNQIKSFGTVGSSTTISVTHDFEVGTEYRVRGSTDGFSDKQNNRPLDPKYVDGTGLENGTTSDGVLFFFKTLQVTKAKSKNGYITDRFNAPTTAPADFKQWNAIRAEDVTTGGSTSANPVEFDIGQPDLGSVDRPDDNAAPATSGKFGLLVNFDVEIESLSVQVSSNTSGATTAYVRESDGSRISSEPISGGIAEFDNLGLQPSTDYQIKIDAGGEQYTLGEYDSASYPYSGEIGDIVAGLQDPTEVNGSAYGIKSISVPPINSVRIPQSVIADSAFKLREREYQTSAGSDGQSDFQIATTGDGGHFGISILTVVSVKQNGSVLDSANWSFDPDTDTVTIDTSNVTIASGDTIDIKYDFDVFDSTLQPRAYLSRESTSETSPSISHFRYEYVI